MGNVDILILWKNRIENKTVGGIHINCEKEASQVKVLNTIKDALKPKSTNELSFDWSAFGKYGDYITVEEIELFKNIDSDLI